MKNMCIKKLGKSPKLIIKKKKVVKYIVLPKDHIKSRAHHISLSLISSSVSGVLRKTDRQPDLTEQYIQTGTHWEVSAFVSF